jgi:hypothetical protein|tara:strand:- start:2309 stop:2620 length:312 start_codon:yes stop_codon:yes gene_type:complete
MKLKDYWPYLRRYLQNPKEGREYCHGVLGDKHKVSECHQIWAKNSEELMLIGAYLINEFVTMNEYTPKELSAYQKGISDFGQFFHSCYKEREAARLKAELEAR